MMRLALIVVLLTSLTACWPTVFLSPNDNSYPEEWKKFYIFPIEVASPTAPSSYGATLSEQLRSGLQNNTKLKLANTLEDAQVQITGVIRSYSTAPSAIQQNDQVAQNRLTVSVQFTIITPSKGLEEMQMVSTRFADYPANTSLVDVENQLLEEINQQVMQDLINKLLSNW